MAIDKEHEDYKKNSVIKVTLVDKEQDLERIRGQNIDAVVLDDESFMKAQAVGEVIIEELIDDLDKHSLSRFVFEKKSKIIKTHNMINEGTFIFPVDFLKLNGCIDKIDKKYEEAFALFLEEEQKETVKILKYLQKEPLLLKNFTEESLDKVIDMVDAENKLIILGRNLFSKLELESEFKDIYEGTCNFVKVIENSSDGSMGTYKGYKLWADFFSKESIIKPNEFFIVTEKGVGFIETKETYNNNQLISNFKIEVLDAVHDIQVVGGEFSEELE